MNFFRRHNAARPEPPDLAGIEAVWFDLDGTLVQVDMQVFVPAYLQRLSARLAALADPRMTARILREAVMQILLAPAGEQTLEELLLDSLQDRLGIHPDQYRQGLAAFCREDLAELSPLVKAHLRTRELLEACLARGWRLVLATNPIFPRAVIEARLAWGGLADLPFEIITSYETARCCKPHLAYFQGLLDALELPPDGRQRHPARPGGQPGRSADLPVDHLAHRAAGRALRGELGGGSRGFPLPAPYRPARSRL